jgi:hypothetical protein
VLEPILVESILALVVRSIMLMVSAAVPAAPEPESAMPRSRMFAKDALEAVTCTAET